MWDGLLDILKQVIQPFIDALKELFCWMLDGFFAVLSLLLTLVTAIFPNWSVPDFVQNGLESVQGLLTAMNWVLPLGVAGPLFVLMFSAFTIYFIILPFYRGIMDLL
jgi:hypothetical protein